MRMTPLIGTALGFVTAHDAFRVKMAGLLVIEVASDQPAVLRQKIREYDFIQRSPTSAG